MFVSSGGSHTFRRGISQRSNAVLTVLSTQAMTVLADLGHPAGVFSTMYLCCQPLLSSHSGKLEEGAGIAVHAVITLVG